jgi:hypothetical protein
MDSTFETKDGDKIALQVGEERTGVAWYGLCGYDLVDFETANAEDAQKLFEALKLITEYEVD